MKNKNHNQWFPIYVDTWLLGGVRIELKPDERAIWIDFLALASKDDGYIRANEKTEYPVDFLARMLNAPEELINRAINRCLETEKIKKSENGIGFYITSWKEYNLSNDYKRRINKKGYKYWKKTEYIPKISEKSGIIIDDNIIEDNIREDNNKNNTFITSLKLNPAYKEIDIDKELNRMDAWLSLPNNKGRKKTNKFILNWLNRIDKPMEIKPIIERDYPKAKDVLRNQGFSEEDLEQ